MEALKNILTASNVRVEIDGNPVEEFRSQPPENAVDILDTFKEEPQPSPDFGQRPRNRHERRANETLNRRFIRGIRKAAVKHKRQ